MTNIIVSNLRGVVSFFFYVLNSMIWVPILYVAAIFKLLTPFKPFRKINENVISWIANSWISCNNLNQRVFGNIRWHVHGLENLKPKDWYLVVANHQTWVDILVLQNVLHRKIPFLKFFLKKELFWFPVMGQAWWALDYPFMKRYSKSFLEKNPHLKGQDLEITKKACEKFKTIPVSVMNFVEGTRFTKTKHKRQQSPHAHLLRPKAGGIAFTLAAMGNHLNSLVDVTIAYPGGAQSFWDFLCGRVRDIRVQVRSLPITEEMLGDYFHDEAFRDAFQNWLNALWEQKDRCIQGMLDAPLPSDTPESIQIPRFLEPIPALKQVILQEPTSSATS